MTVLGVHLPVHPPCTLAATTPLAVTVMHCHSAGAVLDPRAVGLGGIWIRYF